MLFYFPNRPFLISINNEELSKKDADPDWHAEIKYNGDRLCLQKINDKFIFMNRSNQILSRYNAPESVLEELHSLKIPNNSQFDGELMHNHSKITKNHIFFYDIYVHNDKPVRETLEVRREMLFDHFSNGSKLVHLEITKAYDDHFIDVYNTVIKDPENEGIVLKNKKGMITFTTNKSVDVTWQYKIRRETKNYKF